MKSGPRSQAGPFVFGFYAGEDSQMTLSLLLSILLMPGVALAEGGVVAGTLRGTDGKPAARVRVAVMAIPEAGRGLSGAGTLVSQAETDEAGKFQLEDVPAGRYYVVAGRLQTPIFYPGVRDIAAAKTIQVLAEATVRDIDFEVVVLPAASAGSTSSLPVVHVTGRVVVKNKSNAPMPPNITLQAFPPAGANPLGLISGATGTPGALAASAGFFPGITQTLPVAQDGTFKADLFGVDQHLSVVALPAGYSFVSITSGGTNLLNQPIIIKVGVELIVTVDVGDVRPRYRLMALVREDSTDRLLSGERVELVHSSGEVQRLTVNAQGMVTIPGLLPGTYVLRLASAGFDVSEKQVIITDGSVQVELRARKKP